MLRVAAFLFGCLFCLGGWMALAATQGWVPSAQAMGPATLVFVLIGAVLFTAAGLGVILWALGRTAWAARAAAVAALAFVLAFNWLAFGPGERRFGRTLAVSTATVHVQSSEAASETEGRWVFGLFALALDTAALLALWRGLGKDS